MAEYIDRDAFKAEIRRLSTHYLNEWDTLGVLAAADRIPAADVVPVRHGKWLIKIIRGDKRSVCSECLLETGTCYEENYCPNCGAKMDAEEREKLIRKAYIDVGSCRGWIVEGGLNKDGDGDV